AGAQVGLLRRPAARQSDHYNAVVDLGGVEAEPRPRRSVAPSEREQVVEDRLQQIDGNDHVEVLSALPARLFEMQRADAEKVALRSDHGGAAPIGMRGRRED